MLPTYASRLPAVELNNTWYRWPSESQVRAWASATPASFRFAVKAQRAASYRALGPGADHEIEQLIEPLAGFGDRLGSVLFRVPEPIARADTALRAVLDRWPPTVPLAVELQHPSWHVDETFAALRERGAALCATELPDHELPPTLRLTGPFLYLRLRRHDYTPAAIGDWAARLEPFLAAGTSAFVFFRHDPVGRGAELALELLAAARRVAATAASG